MEHTHQRRRQQLNRLLLIAIWMILIFAFSAQPAVESSRISDGISYRIIEQINRITHAQWTDVRIEKYAEAIHYPIRKAAHMTEYAILALLVWNYLNVVVWIRRVTGNKRIWLQILLAEVVAFAYAATDEFHQTFVLGRSGEFKDVCIDSAGALLALIIVGIVTGITRGMYHAKRDEKESD